MEEHYVKRCLPIFPIPNNFTCSFISLGRIAYFVTYPEDRPQGMPPVCLFSPDNHPPKRDFIEHLPYSLGDSSRQVKGLDPKKLPPCQLFDPPSLAAGAMAATPGAKGPKKPTKRAPTWGSIGHP